MLINVHATVNENYFCFFICSVTNKDMNVVMKPDLISSRVMALQVKFYFFYFMNFIDHTLGKHLHSLGGAKYVVQNQTQHP